MQSGDSLEKTLMLGKIESRRRRGWQRTRFLDDIIELMHMSLSKLWEMMKNREALCAAVHGVTELNTTEWLNNNNDNCLYVELKKKDDTNYLTYETEVDPRTQKTSLYVCVLSCFSQVWLFATLFIFWSNCWWLFPNIEIWLHYYQYIYFLL